MNSIEDGTGIGCSRCDTVNPPHRKFCSQCGDPLWEPCIHCGASCSVSERFCGECGANLKNAAHRQIERHEANLQRAADLQEEYRFDEALELLSEAARAEPPQLAELVGRAHEEIAWLVKRRDQIRTVIQRHFEDAQEFFSTQNYRGAAEELAAIPPPLRSPEMSDLLEEAQKRLAEADALDRELREAVAAKEYGGLLGKVARLLELNDGHALARQLAGQLQTLMCRKVRAELADNRYDEALQILEEVPESLRTETIEKLYQYAAELSWMMGDLLQSPVIDPALLEIAERAEKAAPKNERLQKLAAELRKRASRAAETPLVPVPWAAPPKQPELGIPVDWLTLPESLTLDKNADATPLIDGPGEFLAACGLALQGLGLAEVQINLAPADNAGLLGRMKKMVRPRTARSAWGIDVGAAGLRAVKLVLDERQKRPVITRIRFIAHRKLLSQAAGDAEGEQLFDDALQEFIKQGHAKADRICAGISARWLLRKQFKLPPMDAAKLDRAVEYEARLLMPMKLDGLAWDYHVLGENDASSPGSGGKTSEKPTPSPRHEHDVVVLAVKRLQVERLLQRFQGQGLQVDAVQVDAIALYNMLFYEHFAGNIAESRQKTIDPLAILDIGADTSTLTVCGPRSLWFRNFGIGGQSFSRALVQEFQLTFAQAEELKRQPAGARRLSRLYGSIAPICEELAHEIQTSLDLYKKAYPQLKIGRLIAVGGGMRLHGLYRYLC